MPPQPLTGFGAALVNASNELCCGDKVLLCWVSNYQMALRNAGNFNVLLSPLEFIEKLAAIIPPPYRHQVNYYGCLSSHSKLRPLKVPRQAIDAGPAEKKPIPGVPLEELPGDDLEEEAEKPSRYIPWAELLKRTFGIDLTVCPHCGGHGRVIAAVIRKEAIREILVHLNLPTGPPTTKKRSGTEYVYERLPNRPGVCSQNLLSYRLYCVKLHSVSSNLPARDVLASQTDL